MTRSIPKGCLEMPGSLRSWAEQRAGLRGRAVPRGREVLIL